MSSIYTEQGVVKVRNYDSWLANITASQYQVYKAWFNKKIAGKPEEK